MNNKLDELKERVFVDNPKSIHIARVPKKVKKRFIDLAVEEFEGDYGFLLMFLMEGLVDKDMREVIIKIEELEQRINNLESKPAGEPEGKFVKLLNGKKVRIGTGGKE